MCDKEFSSRWTEGTFCNVLRKKGMGGRSKPNLLGAICLAGQRKASHKPADYWPRAP